MNKTEGYKKFLVSIPSDSRDVKNTNLGKEQEDFWGCREFEKSYKEFLKLKAWTLPFKVKSRHSVNFYESRAKNIKWVHVFAFPLFPDPSQGYLTYIRIVIMRVNELSPVTQDEIMTHALSSKTRQISNYQVVVRDTDICVIYDSCAKGFNMIFSRTMQRKSFNGGGDRGIMSFSIRQGHEMIEKSIMGILGKWLSARWERISETAKRKNHELYGDLGACSHFVGELGEFLTSESERIHIPPPATTSATVDVTKRLKMKVKEESMRKEDEMSEEDDKKILERIFDKKIDRPLTDEETIYVQIRKRKDMSEV